MNTKPRIQPRCRLEVCCGDPRSIAQAVEGGADRIELCSGLSEGGLTPSAALIRLAADTPVREVNVLIRPRKGDFLYSYPEWRVVEDDIRMAFDCGATGIVCGALEADGSLDLRRLERLRRLSEGCYLTFHRAFDLCRDPHVALTRLKEYGADCLLTSGQAPSALQGAPLIASLVSQAGNGIEVMAGAGVTPENCSRIVSETGVRLIHATARASLPTQMQFRRPGIHMGAPDDSEYACKTTSADQVAAIISAIEVV